MDVILATANGLSAEQVAQRDTFFMERWSAWEPRIRAQASKFAQKTLLPDYDFEYFFSKGEEYFLYACTVYKPERGAFASFAKLVLDTNWVLDLQKAHARARVPRYRTRGGLPNPKDTSIQEDRGEYVVGTAQSDVIEVILPVGSLDAKIDDDDGVVADFVASPQYAEESVDTRETVKYIFERLAQIPSEQAALATTILRNILNSDEKWSSALDRGYYQVARLLKCEPDFAWRAWKLLQAVVSEAFEVECVLVPKRPEEESKKAFILRFLREHPEGVHVSEIARALVVTGYAHIATARLLSNIIGTMSDLRNSLNVTIERSDEGRYAVA